MFGSMLCQAGACMVCVCCVQVCACAGWCVECAGVYLWCGMWGVSMYVCDMCWVWRGWGYMRVYGSALRYVECVECGVNETVCVWSVGLSLYLYGVCWGVYVSMWHAECMWVSLYLYGMYGGVYVFMWHMECWSIFVSVRSVWGYLCICVMQMCGVYMVSVYLCGV